MKKNIEKMLLIVANVIIVLLITFILYRDKVQKEEVYLQNKLKQLKSEFVVEIGKYENISNLYYNLKIKDNKIFSNLAKKDFSDRWYFYNYFLQDYKYLRDVGFDRFIIVYPDGTVFLRMHNFNKFGDKLSDIGNIVNTANTLSLIDKDFADSLIFFYPIYYNKLNVGNLYLNVPFFLISKNLSKTFDKAYMFILKKDFINIKENKGFVESEINKDYFVDTRTYKKFKFDEVSEVNKIISEKVLDKIGKEDSFIIPVEIDDKYVLVSFIGIKNFKNVNVGYLISYEEDFLFKNFSLNFFITMGFLLVILFLINLFILYAIKMKDLAETKAITDKLTGLFNRTVIDTLIQIEVDRSNRNNRPLSIIVFDIDHFKRINDEYGHDKGDYVLKTIADIVKMTLRKSDYIIRWGGEEFLVILPETNLENAINVAEKIRFNIENYNFKDIVKATVSLGVTEMKKGENFYTAFKRADEALYMAKNKGRNRVEFIY